MDFGRDEVRQYTFRLIEAIPTIPGTAGSNARRVAARRISPLKNIAKRRRAEEGRRWAYLFNFFTSREEGANAYEPPFEVLLPGA